MNWRKIIIGTWSWKRPFYSIGFIYLCLALVACTIGDRFIFHPPGTPYPKSEYFITIPGEEKIAAYYRPPHPGEKILLWSHGNAQNIGSTPPLMNVLAANGFGIMAYDYPGYGETPGKPSQNACYTAIRKAYDHLTQDLGHAPEDIILCGQSVGTGPTTWLATQVPHHSTILLSPFLSAFRTVTHVPILPGDRFPNLTHIKKFHRPLLIIHGELDQVVPHAQGQRLFEESPSANKKFLSLPDTGHNNLFRKAFPEIIAALEKLKNSP